MLVTCTSTISKRLPCIVAAGVFTSAQLSANATTSLLHVKCSLFLLAFTPNSTTLFGDANHMHIALINLTKDMKVDILDIIEVENTTAFKQKPQIIKNFTSDDNSYFICYTSMDNSSDLNNSNLDLLRKPVVVKIFLDGKTIVSNDTLIGIGESSSKIAEYNGTELFTPWTFTLYKNDEPEIIASRTWAYNYDPGVSNTHNFNSSYSIFNADTLAIKTAVRVDSAPQYEFVSTRNHTSQSSSVFPREFNDSGEIGYIYDPNLTTLEYLNRVSTVNDVSQMPMHFDHSNKSETFEKCFIEASTSPSGARVYFNYRWLV